MADRQPRTDLARLTQKVNLGGVDAFVSHSNHDNADEKWLALQDWIKEFKEVHHREPLLWIDKYCID